MHLHNILLTRFQDRLAGAEVVIGLRTDAVVFAGALAGTAARCLAVKSCSRSIIVRLQLENGTPRGGYVNEFECLLVTCAHTN